ncbi:MAG: glycosyltransferase [Gammaproteobacteria bacterium]|nr:glycosyltransferase [Gammaproteobacteria bacterium]
MQNPQISIVIPVHNEQEVLEILYERLTKVMDALNRPYEVILTNDGSKDRSAEMLNEFHKRRPKQFRIIHFNRNYGQHMAIMAGFEHVLGEYVLTMDADLQNPPEDIPKIIEALDKGHDVINTYRMNRQDKKWRIWVSRLHNYFRTLIAPALVMKDEGSMLRGYARKIVDLMASTKETSTFIPALALTFAANPTEVGIAHEERAAGDTSYNLYKLIRYNFDLVTNFSVVPLQVFTMVGILISVLSLIFVVYLFIRRLVIGPEAAGVFTLFAIAFFIMGFIIFGLGIVGEYIGRIYQEVLDRPRFVVKEIVEEDRD